MDKEMMQFCNDLLESVRQMKSGESKRKTELLPLSDGRLRRLITRADGTIEQDDILPIIVSTRLRAGLTQVQFSQLLGVSVRTLQGWEQGRKQPSGAAKTLLKIAQQQPELLKSLANDQVAA
jgi:putative transcriptional regulator